MNPYAKNFCPPLCPRIGLGCNYECENAEPNIAMTQQSETQQHPVCTIVRTEKPTLRIQQKKKGYVK